MALIKSEVPAVAVGTFTKNLVKAAPVQWDSNIVYNVKKAQAVIVNTGIANAATGAEGLTFLQVRPVLSVLSFLWI